MEQIFYPYFSISMTYHIVLAVLALLVFGYRFYRQRKMYQLVLAIAFPCTLLPYAVNTMSFFYAVGVFEGLALLLALILSQTVDKRQKPSDSTTDPQENSSAEP
jgi:membrane protein implicated in regulation of membrane protease activity